MANDLSGALVRGAIWSIGLRWGLRLIGLVSTFVIARLLTPADYGLIAMATLVMGLVETFLDADASTALLRSPNLDKSFADTAWTLKVLQSLALATVIALCAPFAARYFEEPRLTSILWTYSLITVVAGFGSIGPLIARRDLDFAMEVKIALLTRIVSFVSTIAFAFTLRSYWALIFGSVFGMLSGFVAGYAMHPFRPRWTFSHVKELFGFSQWMLVSGIGIFLARKFDGFVVGRVGSAADLGIYNISLELGQMVTIELGAPLNRALLPVLANLHDEPVRMQSALMKTVAAVNTVTLPAGVGLAMVAPLAVPTLLGSQWTAAVPLLMIFSVIGAIRFITGPYYTMLMTLGHSRLLAFMSWFELGVFAIAVAFFYRDGIPGIAEARVVSTVAIGLVWVVLGTRYGLTAAALLRAIARPLLGSLLMAGALSVLPTTGLSDPLELFYRIFVGGLVYCLWIAASWHAVGRPAGLETMAADRLRNLGRRTIRAIR